MPVRPNSPPLPVLQPEQIDELLLELDALMPGLQLRHANIFALANAWAERHDAILALSPPSLRADVEARLSRIGIRWGMAPGMRVTGQFRALDIASRMELGYLADCARGRCLDDAGVARSLVERGLLRAEDGGHVLTPAGRRVLQTGAAPRREIAD